MTLILYLCRSNMLQQNMLYNVLLAAFWMLVSRTIAQPSPSGRPFPPPVPSDSVIINVNRTADLAPGGHRFAFRLYVNVGPEGVPPASQGTFFDSTRRALAGVFLVRARNHPYVLLLCAHFPRCA